MSKPLEQTIQILSGWDLRDQDKGFHGCEVLFILRGPAGVITFACATDWTPMAVQQKYMNGVQRTNIIGIQPVAMDCIYHSFEPSENGKKHQDCPYTTAGVCYTSSGGNAGYLRDILLKEGSEGIWRELGHRYRSAAKVTQNARKV